MVEVVTISMDRTLKDLLDRHCSLYQCGRSEIVRRAIMRYLSPEEMEGSPSEEPIAKDLVEVEVSETPEPEPVKIEAEEVSEKVRKILKGELYE